MRAILIAFVLAVARAMPAAAKDRPAIEWVRIPGGSFTLGSGSGGQGPAHTVTVKSFELAKTLVTNRQYGACVEAKVCTPARGFGEKFGGLDQPVVGVDWRQAKVFSRWVGGRLPSEAEWEYAARNGGKDWTYPWGNDNATCELAVISGCSDSATMPVCSKPKGNTEQGLCDMAGNAYEWTEDVYHRSYAGAPADGRAWGGPGKYRVVRGGSWSQYTSFVAAGARDRQEPQERADNLGFRPAR